MLNSTVESALAGTGISVGISATVVFAFLVLLLLSYSLREKHPSDPTEPGVRETLGRFCTPALTLSIASLFVALLPLAILPELRVINVALGMACIVAVNRTRADLASPNLRERGLPARSLFLVVPCALLIGFLLVAVMVLAGALDDPLVDVRSALQMMRVQSEILPGTTRYVAYARLRAEHLVAFNYFYAHATEDGKGDFERFDDGPWPDPSRTPTPVMMKQGNTDGLDPAHPFALVEYPRSAMLGCTSWQFQKITFDNQDRVRAIVNDGPPEDLCP